MKKFYLFTLFFFSWALFLKGQATWVNLTFTNHVTAIEKTGPVWWIGTTGGLIKYDTVSKAITVFNRGNSELKANYMNDLTVDDNQKLWVATKNGLMRYEGGRQFSVFSPATAALYSYNVLHVKNEKGEGLWVATDTSLSFFDGSNWTHYFKDGNGNNLENISYLYPASPYGVLFGFDNHVEFLDHKGNFTDYNYPGASVVGLAYDGLGNVYVANGPYTGGFYEYASQWDYYNKDNSPLAVNQISDLKNDAKYNLYFLHEDGFSMKTASGNYWKIQRGMFKTAEDGLDNEARCVTTAIYPDTLGAVGLNHGFVPYTFTETYSGGYYSRFVFDSTVDINTSALHTNRVMAVTFHNGKTYVGTRGVAVWNNKYQREKEYTRGSLALFNPTGWLDVDVFGRIWVADYTNRLLGSTNKMAMIDAQGNVTDFDFEHFLGIPIAGIDALQWETTRIAPDTAGALWISFYGKQRNGIAWYDDTAWHVFPDTTGVPNGFTQFVTDDQGIKWFATMGGIYSFDGKKWTSYWKVAPIHQATCVAKDKAGNLWFGGKPDAQLGWTGGLAKYDGKNWTRWDVNNSLLPDNYVTSIAVDTTGTIWVGTRNGGVLKITGEHSLVLSKDKDAPFDNNFIYKIAVNKETNDVWFLNWDAGIFIYNEKGVYTAVKKYQSPVSSHLLAQNYPNPFTGFTTLTFTVPKNMGEVPVSLEVYNIVGQKIKTLVSGWKSPGTYSVRFRGDGMAPGIYLYRLKMGNQSIVKKMLLAK